MTHSRRPTICRVVPGAIKALGLLLPILLSRPLFAQGRVYWQEGGVLLRYGTWDGSEAAVADGTGGAIAVWNDRRSGWPQSAFAQRLDSLGNCLWTEGGVMVRRDIGLADPCGVGDSRGGAIFVWSAISGVPYVNQVTAQRVDSCGTRLWGEYGVSVVGSNEDRGFESAIVKDGRGGAIVAWEMTNNATSGRDSVAACRLDSYGVVLWMTQVTVDSLYDFVSLPLAGDGCGGAYVAWTASTRGIRTVKAQHLDSVGRLLWDTAGVRPSVTAHSHHAGPAVPAEGNTVVLSWRDSTGGVGKLAAQRLSFTGQPMWGPAGVPIRTGSQGPLWDGYAIPGPSGRSTWCWLEKAGSTYSVYAQRLDGAGTRLWDTCGVFVGCTGCREFRDVAIQPDGRDGAIVVWRQVDGSNWDLYAQRLDATGRRCWGDSGLAVCRDTNLQQWLPAVVSDAAGGAIAVWGDFRYGPPPATSGYAQRFGDAPQALHSLGDAPDLGSVRVTPSIVGASAVIELSGIGAAEASLELFDLLGRRVACAWRGVCTRPLALSWTPVDDRGARIPDGVYYMLLKNRGGSTRAAVLTIVGQ